jgi:putative mycofactocin binding protein MftB
VRRLLTLDHLHIVLDSRLALDPQVALRPEPFGALAYHYGNRKLIFLKHPDIVRVVRALDGDHTLAETLTACGIDESRWPSFERALTALTESEMLHEHQVAPG